MNRSEAPWVAALLLVAVTLAGAGEKAVAPNAVLILAQDADIFIPGQPKIRVPAGSEIHSCSGPREILSYDLDSRTFVMLEPCATDTLFQDGFE